jgi:hypothetical protein
VVLAYKWRSVVYSIGKEHGQNRGPTSLIFFVVINSYLYAVWHLLVLQVLIISQLLMGFQLIILL